MADSPPNNSASPPDTGTTPTSSPSKQKTFAESFPAPETSTADVRAWLMQWFRERQFNTQRRDIQTFIANVAWNGQSLQKFRYTFLFDDIDIWGGEKWANHILKDIEKAQKIAKSKDESKNRQTKLSYRQHIVYAAFYAIAIAIASAWYFFWHRRDTPAAQIQNGTIGLGWL